MKTFRGPLARLFGIDLRSLALFRALTAAILLVDLANRAMDLTAHYTDIGAMPRDAVVQYGTYPGDLSFHMISGEPLVMALFFAAAAAAAVCLLVGYRARLACFVSWALLVSLHSRNQLVLQGGDQLLRDLLFFAAFLPLGARYSVDEALTPALEPPREEAVLSFGSAALLLQVFLMYFFTALLKSGPEWRPDGSAIEYALRIEQFAKPFGVWLRDFPGLLRWMTWGTWWFELLGPFLLFPPVAFVPLRLAAIAGFLGLHLGLYNAMELGLFPFVSAAAMAPFIPGEVWDFLGRQCALPSWREPLRKRLSRPLGLRPLTIRTSRPCNGAAAVSLALAVWWSASSVQAWSLPTFAPLTWLENMIRLDETWDMFGPAPLREDGWFVIPGKLEDGSEVDVYRGLERPVRWEQPERVAATFKNDRWRSYMMNIWNAESEDYRLYYARYLCETWNAERPDGRRLASLEIYFVEKYVELPPRTSEPKRIRIWDHSCLDEGEAAAR